MVRFKIENKPVLALGALIALVLASLAASAGDLSARYTFAIAPQTLSSALLVFSEQTEIQVATASADLKNLNTLGVTGQLTATEALKVLFAGTDLTFRAMAQNSVAIEPRKTREPEASAARTGSDMELHLAQTAPQSQASGKSDAAASSTDTSATIQEIIVTATKRSERLQDVPLSIAVISGEDIERRGVIGMEDYLRSIPGVNQIDNGAQGNAIVIRGISTSPESENTSTGAGATVATYFDEASITGAGGMAAGQVDVRPVDIERIEVLRGPQGTAFGSSSLGGTVRMIPVKPQLDAFGVKAAGSYSNTAGEGGNNNMIQGIVNMPLIADRLAVRFVGYRYDESGAYHNIGGRDPIVLALATANNLGSFVSGYSQDNVGQMVSTGGRAAALWKPTDKLDLSLNFLTQKVEQDGLPRTTVSGYDQAVAPIGAAVRIRGESGEVADNNFDLLGLVGNYDFGPVKLTATTSWMDSDSNWASSNAGGPTGYYSALTSSTFESFTVETRLASQFNGPFQLLAGLFYEDIDEGFLQTANYPGPVGSGPAVTLFANIPITRQREQQAAFSELSYRLTEKITATVGGRYYKYDRSGAELREGALFNVPLGTTAPVLLHNEEDGTSLKANLSYKPNEDTLLYATWAQGFRLGKPAAGLTPSLCDRNGDGIADGSNVSIASTQLIGSDTLENYEIGSKFSLMDRRLIIDAAVYHILWDQLPVRVLAPASPAGCGAPYVANVGAAKSDGVEFQASWLVAKGFKVDFGAGYNIAELTEDAPGLAQPAFKGDRLPGTPKFNANLALQYDFQVAGYETFVRADSFYTGEFFGNLNTSLPTTATTAAGDYVKTDARAGVKIKDLSMELYVRNLTNEDDFTWRGLTNSNSGRGFDAFGYRLRPRTIGVQVGYSFQ